MINIYNIFARMKMRAYFFIVFSVAIISGSCAQKPASYSSSDLYSRIKKLKVLGSVLYVAAHPDDENTRLLSYLSKDRLYRAGYLSLTRGDGGQNLIGDEQGIELGLIRTQELLAARRIDGAEQFFSRAYDFGFSKSTEEALRIWNKDKVLADAVWIVRNFQPDVIIARFPPDARAGHGHHSASAVIAEEAFAAAADPNRFPEQLKNGVKPWQAKRIFWNSYNFSGNEKAAPGQLTLDVGGFDPVQGKSYGEIAAESRSQHKSQGFGVPASRGSQYEFFTQIAGNKAQQEIMEGIETGWERIGAPQVGRSVDSILQNFKTGNPSASVPALLRLYSVIEKLPAGHWKQIKLQELQDIIAAAEGIWLEAFTTKARIAQGEELNINFVVNNRGGGNVRLNAISMDDFDTSLNIEAAANRNISLTRNLVVPRSVLPSQPYWLRQKMNHGSFNVTDQQLIGKPESEPPFIVSFHVTIEGREFVYQRALKFKNTDPVKGEQYNPIIVLPAKNAPPVGILRHISYDHIPDIYYFSTDTGKIAITNVKIQGKKIGYIEGAGDKVPAALTLMGYEVTILKEQDIFLQNLKQFDAIITGVRAYNVHDFLTEKNSILNDYVSGGGNLVVQYNTNSFAGPNNAAIGPFSFHISRDRVTDETSPVRLLLPNHPVFNYPNKIDKTDFDNWVQERAIYFADQLDPAFVTPIAMKDPGEEEQNGSLIIADYGKGKFVYTGIVFFRELPAGVIGAYRLLANIIALNKKPQ